MTPTRRIEVAESLVRTHQGSVRGFLLFLGCPEGWVDDLVQDVFLSVLSSEFEDRGERATAALLRTVAKNLLLKSRRREARSTPLEGLDRLDDSGRQDLLERAWVEFEADDGGERYLEALRGCLTGLSTRQREVLEWRYRAARPLSRIARESGMTEAGVKSVLVRSKKALRACIERKLGA